MALYNVYIHKTVDSVQGFGNRYIVSAPSLTDASNIAGFFLIAERAIHSTNVVFDYVRVSSVAPGDDQYNVFPEGLAGQYAATGDGLPRFLTLRVDFGVQGGGRPSRKYYHNCVTEDQQAAGAWTTTYLNAVNTAMNTLFASVVGTTPAYFADVDGQAIISHTQISKIGYHKFSKRSRRAAATP